MFVWLTRAGRCVMFDREEDHECGWLPISSEEPAAPSRIVRVKISVAIDCEGTWNACGWGPRPDQAAAERLAKELASEEVCDGKSIYWVTADLQIPEEREVRGEVGK